MPSVFVAGEPIGKGRPRLGRNGRVYTPDTTRKAEHTIASAWWSPVIDLETPVEVRVTAYYGRPQAHTLKSGQLSAAGKRAPVPMKRPDLDNVVKLVLDALNGVAYRDDSQVLRFAAKREWATEQGPGLQIMVRPITDLGSPEQ